MFSLQSFPCHRFVMSARSDVFRAMFSHDMRENKVSPREKKSNFELFPGFLHFNYRF